VTLVDEMNNLRREHHRQLLRQGAVRRRAADAAGDPALAEHILLLEEKARALEEMAGRLEEGGGAEGLEMQQ